MIESKTSSAREQTALLDGLSTAVILLDPDLKVQFANSAAELLLDSSRSRLLGNRLGDLLEVSEKIDHAISQALEAPQTVTVRSVELIAGNSARPLHADCTVTPFTSSDGNPQLVIELANSDPLNQLVMEDHYHERQASQRNMFRGIAHEIKNPLAGIRGAAQLLDGQLEDRDLRQYTRIIVHEVDRLANLVDRMALSNRPLEMCSINIHEVVEPVRRLITAEVGPGVQIIRDYDPSLPNLRGCAETLEQALLNIARNAVRAVGRKGSITFRTRISRRMTIDHVHHRALIRVDVIDTGAGIDDELKAHIFEPMVSGSADGSGLGLSIAREIISRHGGLISLDTEAGDTCFHLFIPVEANANE